MILQFILNGFITGLLYALIALAFSFTYNTTRIFHIAYASVIVSGGYFMLWLSQHGVTGIIAVLITIFFCGLLNFTINKGIYHPLANKKSSHNIIMVTSIGVFIVLTNLVALLFGNENQVLTTEFSKGLSFGNLILTKMQLWQLIIASATIITILLIISKSSIGLRIKALSNNNVLYTVFGNNGKKLISMLYLISGGLAGAVSLLLAYDIGFDPYYGMGYLLNALVALIIGGFGSYKGAVVGGIMLGIIQSFSIYFFEARWETAITFLIFLIVLILRPQGFFGTKIRWV